MFGGGGGSSSTEKEITEVVALTFENSLVMGRDVANQSVQGRISQQTYQFPLIQTNAQAFSIADRELRKLAYPRAEVTFKANRKLFRCKPGDLYNFIYPLYGITQMVLRIVKVEEEGPESESIKIYAIEDIYFLANSCVISSPSRRSITITFPIEDLTHTELIELPYDLSEGETIKLGAIASRKTGSELGYVIYGSLDGSSYESKGNTPYWGVKGRVMTPYSTDTHDLDDGDGFEVYFENSDFAGIDSIARAQLFGYTNLAKVGNEFISFQNVELTGTRQYKLTGIIRERFDTQKAAYVSGENFWYYGTTGINSAEDSVNYYYGATRYGKYVPYNARAAGDLSTALENSVTLGKRAWAPYYPTNLKCNDCGLNYRSTYSTDCVLVWAPRLRTGAGCGFGDVDTVVDAAPTWEGYFEVKVYVGGVLVRTTSAINDDTWTYTEAMNLSDNTSLASEVTFTLLNYISSGVERYDSESVSLIVRKET
jgi:hypothetical protein